MRYSILLLLAFVGSKWDSPPWLITPRHLVMYLSCTFLTCFFMFRPMILLAIGVAIPGEHAYTCLETGAPSCHAAAVGTAGVYLVHPVYIAGVFTLYYELSDLRLNSYVKIVPIFPKVQYVWGQDVDRFLKLGNFASTT